MIVEVSKIYPGKMKNRREKLGTHNPKRFICVCVEEARPRDGVFCLHQWLKMGIPYRGTGDPLDSHSTIVPSLSLNYLIISYILFFYRDMCFEHFLFMILLPRIFQLLIPPPFSFSLFSFLPQCYEENM